MARQTPDMAIVGVAARYPGHRTIDEFWEALLADRSLIAEMPESRRRLLREAPPAAGGAVRHGVFLDDVNCFDRALFAISPPGAMFADPRQRLLLESCWEAIEDAGLKKTALSGRRVGVFVGQDAWYWGSYADTGHPDYVEAQEFVLPGNNPTFLANRISSVFGFHGPSLAINTTCSSVYAAMHQACASLRRGECDYALVGGVTLFHRPPPDRFESLANTMLSFSADAAGYVSSEGCGALLLCPAPDAAAARHTTHAMIGASGCSAGGTTNSFAQPSESQLTALLSETLEAGGLAPEQIGYVEAHGIASLMGDAVEANALQHVLGGVRRTGPCLVSTIKPSIGHAHAASGIFSLIKAILALRHERVPAIHGLRGRPLNAGIRAASDGLHFLTEPTAWPRGGEGAPVRHVLLPSFGFSNVNAAIVLRDAAPECAVSDAPAGTTPRPVVVCLSARSEAQLVTQATRLHGVVAREIAARADGGAGELGLADIAYTLQAGREVFRHRWATVVSSLEQLADVLVPVSRGERDTSPPPGAAAGVDAATDPLADISDDEASLAARWVAGADVIWPEPDAGERSRRAHLPAYPFAREHYWLPRPASAGADERRPLLRRVTSSGDGTEYRVRLAAPDFCIDDHRLRGQLVLSGAASLEIAVAAVCDAGGTSTDAVHVRHHAWLRPLEIDAAGATELFVRVMTDASGSGQSPGEPVAVRYEIGTRPGDTSAAIVHATGHATIVKAVSAPVLDLPQIRAAMTGGVLDAAECYAIFRRQGLDYGPAHRGIQEIALGQDQVLATLRLSDALFGASGPHRLHPGLLDSALQAYLGMYVRPGRTQAAGDREPVELRVPFGLDDGELFGPLPVTLYSWLRRASATSAGAGDKFDVDLCGEDGTVVARLRGLTLRPMPQHTVRTRETAACAGAQPAQAVHDHTGDGVAAYVRAVIAEVLRVPLDSLAADTPFKELGIDSLLGATLTASLERRFGPLPKTLFFEHGDIRQLADHLETHHRPPPARAPAVATPASPFVTKADVPPGSDRFRRLETWGATTYQNSVLFDAWPQLYVSPEGHGCLHVIRRDDRVFATGMGYARAVPGEPALVEELAAYCSGRGLLLSYLSTGGPLGADLERRAGLLAVPVGCYQTIEDLSTFSLAGSRMRRLRYLVQRFQNQRGQRTVEYGGGDRATDDAIRAVLLAWSRPKGIVSNVDTVLRDLDRGALTQRYRIFLTYLDTDLQNAIMMLPIDGGYLMDQEYYLPTMPLGGTESAVARIVETLRDEGHARFSLGLTWRRPAAGTDCSDRDGLAFLAACPAPIATMLDHGEQNYQHKSKYRPSEHGVYFYRADRSDPAIIRQSLLEFVSTGLTVEGIEERIRASAEASDDAAPAAPVAELNVISDSWPYHDAPFVHVRMARLTAAAAEASERPDGELERFIGLPGIFMSSGRLAERLFFRAFRSAKKTILQNLLFDTTRHHALSAGFTCVELPDVRIFDPASPERFRGGFDLARLERETGEKAAEIGLVYLELADNGSGGYPVSLAEIRRVAQICRDQALPLAMDVTRIVRNAALIRRFDADCRTRTVWDLVEEIAGCCTYAIGSLCKDFAMNIGGVIATQDADLLSRVRTFGALEGGLVSGAYRKVLAAGIADRDYIERVVDEQLDLSATVQAALAAHDVPVMAPGGGHCILVRAGDVPAFAHLDDPAAALVERLRTASGIQAAAHLAGGQQGTVLNRCVRLAMPVGRPADDIAARLVAALAPLAALRPEARLAAAPIEPPSTSPATRSHVAVSVAIIGMSGRYPGASDLEQYWRNLIAGVDSVAEIPASRWDWRDYHPPGAPTAVAAGTSVCKWGGFLEGIDQFDPLFFAIAPRDAEEMDPQERLFLEACWTALEDAGYSTQQLSDRARQRMAVFGGVTNTSRHGSAAISARPSSFASLVNRVSYALDLHGPSIAIDSLCASSLVAIHEACEYIRGGRGDMALAGAVNLNVDPAGYVRHTKEGLLASDRRGGAFAQGGTGYIPGEGVGVFVLKNLAQAIEDGDAVYAVVRGSAVNHNGRMNAFGVANPKQQAAVIRQALASAGVDPRTVGYVEAAASGVELGDALELNALQQVFGDRTHCEGAYRIGSVKPNVGHCEAAAGMSQATKAVLSLRHRMLAPTIVTQPLNPNVDFSGFPFTIQRQAAPWLPVFVDGRAVPRRAGVTAVSAAGVNAHVILEEHTPAPTRAVVDTGRPGSAFTMVILSAISRDALDRYVTRWVRYLETADPMPSLEHIAYTLRVGRDAMRHRLAMVCADIADLAAQLRAWQETGQTASRSRYGDTRAPAAASRQAAVAPAPETSGAAAELRDLLAHAERWIAGDPLPEEPSMDSRHRRRVAGLPTYPFARHVCGGLLGAPRRDVGDEATRTAADATDALRTTLRAGIHTLLHEILGTRDDHEVDDRTSFSDMGFDSRKLAALVEGLNQRFDLTLTATVPFEHPDVDRLTRHLLSLMALPAASDVDSMLRDYLSHRAGFEQTLERLQTLA